MAVDTVQYIASWLGQHDLPDKVIAAILGNMQIESSDSTSALNGREGAIGLVQWEGGRRTGLQQYAASKGTSETDLNTQLEYLWKELNGPYKGALQGMMAASDAASAAQVFDRQYEVSSGSSDSQRMQAAQQYATNGFHGGAAVPSSVMAGMGGSVSAQAAGASTATQTPAQRAQALKDGLGPMSALLNTIPELKGLLATAITKGMSVPDFVNAVTNSNWYRQSSDTFRQQLILKSSDPATYNKNLLAQETKIQQIGSQLGVSLSAQETHALANSSLNSGWDATTLQNHIGSMWSANSAGRITGQAATIEQQIQQHAADYGIPLSQHALNIWTQKIIAGQDTTDSFKESVMNQAQTMYAPFAQQIKAGQTMRQIADPYISAKANLLEVDPNSINWANDLTIKKAIQGTPATAGGQPPTAQPLWQFEQAVRQDPAWQSTDNAKQQTASALTQLGKDWGFAS